MSEQQAARGFYTTAEGAREGCYSIAASLETLGEAWMKGDEKMVDLLAVCGPETSGFKALVRGEYREGVDHILHTLRTDYLPATLPHLSSAHAKEVHRVLRLADLDGYTPDVYGETSARWSQTWPATGLEPEIEDLAMLLSAEGDRLILGHAPAAAPAVVPVPDAATAQEVVDQFLEAAKAQTRLPNLPSWAVQAWQLELAQPAWSQTQIGEVLVKEHGGSFKQPKVSRGIKTAKAHAAASGLAKKLEEALPKAQVATSVDPAVLEMGARQDGLTPRQRPRRDDLADL